MKIWRHTCYPVSRLVGKYHWLVTVEIVNYVLIVVMREKLYRCNSIVANPTEQDLGSRCFRTDDLDAFAWYFVPLVYNGRTYDLVQRLEHHYVCILCISVYEFSPYSILKRFLMEEFKKMSLVVKYISICLVQIKNHIEVVFSAPLYTRVDVSIAAFLVSSILVFKIVVINRKTNVVKSPWCYSCNIFFCDKCVEMLLVKWSLWKPST